MGAYSDAVLALSPAAYWRLGETEGTTASDSSGNNIDATYVGGFTLGVQGVSPDGNRAVRLDGEETTRVSIGAQASLRPGLGDMSWIAWYRTTSSVYSALYREGSTAEAIQIFINYFGSAERVVVRVDGPSGTIDPFINISGATDGRWHMVAGTADRDGDLAVYFDGSEVVTEDMTSLSADDLDETSVVSAIGAVSATARNFDGDIDEVAVFPSLLTPTNISDLYNTATDRPRMLPLGGVG